jgi:hypothetical protein
MRRDSDIRAADYELEIPALSCHSWRDLAPLANTLKMRATVYHKG